MPVNGSRIYKIQHGERTSLVNAQTLNQAIRYIADRDIRGALATQDEMFKMGKAGAEVEDATATQTGK